jgi:hypothetical protein
MRTAYMAIGLAAVVGLIPAGFAQDSRVAGHGKPGGTAIEVEPASSRGISLVVPIGKVSVDRGSVGGEPVYERRTKVTEGITIVEVSTTPYMPVLAFNGGQPQTIIRPDQPAGW